MELCWYKDCFRSLGAWFVVGIALLLLLLLVVVVVPPELPGAIEFITVVPGITVPGRCVWEEFNSLVKLRNKFKAYLDQNGILKNIPFLNYFRFGNE